MAGKKNIIKTFLIFLSMWMFTSCGPNVPDLSKKDNGKASEYIAGAVLKYDKEYGDALVYDRSILEPTPQPTATAAPNNIQTSNTSAPSADGGSAGVDSQNAGADVSLDELFGIKDVKFEYESSSLKDSYKSDYESYTASKGKKLLFVYFKIKNIGADEASIKLRDKKVEYKLSTADGSNINSRQTIAEGDMNYLDIKLTAGKSRKGMLLFEIPEDTDVKSASLKISKENNTATISLY